MVFNQVSRNGGAEIGVIDKGVKNEFKWYWLEEKDSNSLCVCTLYSVCQ